MNRSEKVKKYLVNIGGVKNELTYIYQQKWQYTDARI